MALYFETTRVESGRFPGYGSSLVASIECLELDSNGSQQKVNLAVSEEDVESCEIHIDSEQIESRGAFSTLVGALRRDATVVLVYSNGRERCFFPSRSSAVRHLSGE